MQHYRAGNEVILAGEPHRPRVAILVRIRGLMVLVGSGAILALSAWFKPVGSGVGTHEQLDLPPCSFLERTGYPCPTCGLTTSVSAMAHGEIFLALKSHPFGVVIFVATMILAAAGAIELLTGRKAMSKLGKPAWWALGSILGLFLGWVVKLIWGTLNGTLPL